MLYAFICEDAENSTDLRTQARPGHLARLKSLQEEGRLVLAGPFPAIDSIDPGPAGFTGSLIVAEFESLDAAIAWADAEPFLANGAYKDIVVKPFKQTLP